MERLPCSRKGQRLLRGHFGCVFLYIHLIILSSEKEIVNCVWTGDLHASVIPGTSKPMFACPRLYALCVLCSYYNMIIWLWWQYQALSCNCKLSSLPISCNAGFTTGPVGLELRVRGWAPKSWENRTKNKFRQWFCTQNTTKSYSFQGLCLLDPH